MKRNNIARFLFLVLILGWAGTEMWPLRDESGKLIDQFGKATNRDAAFEQAYEAAKEAHDPNDENSNEFGILQGAVENAGLVLSNYTWSPNLKFRGQVPDNRLVLQTLQKKVAGKLQLGLDLKGGSSFLVALDTSNLNTNDLDKASATKVALDQAVEVLRARVDTIGVAEPEIRTMGDDKIMVQLPGLSEADQAKAKKLVTEAAFLEFALVHKDSARLLANDITPAGYRKYAHTTKDAQGNSFTD
ncbi:MAG: hypothetical protein CL394_10950, partial [Acidiferrobacteraceae bacterium]|nr:hypothetical protein [Acidiferrobacteraceae bacterium]